jgi:hypothetical protein
MTVRGELHPVRKPAPQIVHEPEGVARIASADGPRQDQFRVGVERGPGPNVAIGEVPGASGLGGNFPSRSLKEAPGAL